MSSTQILNAGSDILNWIIDFCRFLVDAQLPSGAIPTYYDKQLSPSPQLERRRALRQSEARCWRKPRASSAIRKMERAALKAGEFMKREIVPRTRFRDFELFFSCAPRPLYWVDPLNGIPPVNTLAVQWAADHFLALYRLTEDMAVVEPGRILHWVCSHYSSRCGRRTDLGRPTSSAASA